MIEAARLICEVNCVDEVTFLNFNVQSGTLISVRYLY